MPRVHQSRLECLLLLLLLLWCHVRSSTETFKLSLYLRRSNIVRLASSSCAESSSV